MERNKTIINSISSHLDLVESSKNYLIPSIEQTLDVLLSAIKNNRKIIWCGNGGSASQANHLSAELIGGMYKNKKDPFNSICLNTDTAFITAWSNDDSFDNIFSRQIQAFASKGDALILLTTSGNSLNQINAAKICKKLGINVISITGKSGGELLKISDYNINIDNNSTQRIQEMHIMIGHIICDIIEDSL